MLKHSLVYIHAAEEGERFVGCGAYIEQNLIATCRHVWRDAGEAATAVFPHAKRNGKPAASPLLLVDACQAAEGDDIDLVLLRPVEPPEGVTPLQVARDAAYECGGASALVRLPTRKTDREIEGVIGAHIDEKGRRAFSQPNATGYWLEPGSSGSPLFLKAGQQLAGLVSMAELGDEPQNAPVREAYVVPGAAIWPYVRAVMERELDAQQQAVQRDLLARTEGTLARDLIFEIARRFGAEGETSFEQALTDARAAYDKGLDAIAAGARGAKLGQRLDDLLKQIAERTQAGDFAGGAEAADRAFAEWERIEAERRAESLAAAARILDEGARQDMLRKDYESAARRHARLVALEHPNDATAQFKALRARQDEVYIAGRDLGLNNELELAIALARLCLAEARTADQRGLAANDLGVALRVRGERESGTARLDEAVVAYRAALQEYTRERVPLDWAMTQNNLGNALWALGERESGTARLDEAVVAYRAALQERTRERVPLDWAATQNNLGLALATLGERESGTARLDEAVVAYRAALQEYTRERVPLDWATTQNNLGTALATLGERESGTARLDEAVAAFRAALQERTRERVPLDWAATQNNLGNALWRLGERESGTARLDEAVVAYRAALQEYTRERVPLDWATTQNNLGTALATLGERESATARLDEAVVAYRAALQERTRERVPLDWAATQNNLGNALWRLGERESGTARLDEAVVAYRAALQERTRERVPLAWAATQNNLGNALWRLGERESGTARLDEAVVAYRAALQERTRERVPLAWAATQNNLGNALWRLGERESGTARLDEAVVAYRAALQERTRERAPLAWAATQNNLDSCLALLEQRRSAS